MKLPDNNRIDASLFFTTEKTTLLSLYLVAFGSLWFGYAKFVVPLFGYSGFDWQPNSIKVLESSLALLFFIMILPSKIGRPSDFLIHMHFLFPVLPMLVLYGASDLPREYIYFVILAFSVVCFLRKIKMPKIKGEIIPASSINWSLLILAGVYILSIFLQGGIKYFNLDLLKVYEFRSEAYENLPSIAGYLSPLVGEVLLPFVLLLSFVRHKWLITILAIVGSVLMFALTSHKGPLFYPFFIVVLYYVMHSKKKAIIILLIGYILIVFLSILPFFILQDKTKETSIPSILIGSLLLRRGYFVPPHLNFVYYDFFSKNEHTMLSQSKLTFGLVKYPYGLDSSHLIGYYYYDNIEAGANTGWLGTGYMHFGFTGMLFYSLIISLLFSTIDALARKRKFEIYGAAMSVPTLSVFLSSDLPTVMLTGGLIVSFLLIWICRLD